MIRIGEHEFFKPKTLEEGKENAVGNCNDLTIEERWEQETPIFASAILKQLPRDGNTILDYGCGIGRLAKEILKQNKNVRVIGVDESIQSLELAKPYVNDSRFLIKEARDLTESVDLVYCVYVLQHVPAIEIREILQRIHYCLKERGIFVLCTSEYRMAIRFDCSKFEDDHWLGVDLTKEVSRYFVLSGDLFSPEILANNVVVNKIVSASHGGLPHPALVYKKKIQSGPLFNYR